jgi:hypothetical protein
MCVLRNFLERKFQKNLQESLYKKFTRNYKKNFTNLLEIFGSPFSYHTFRPPSFFTFWKFLEVGIFNYNLQVKNI